MHLMVLNDSLCFSLEDRFLTTLSSQGPTSAAHLQLPSPPEVLPEQAGGATPEPDAASSSEGTVHATFPAICQEEKCLRLFHSPQNFKTLYSQCSFR